MTVMPTAASFAAAPIVPPLSDTRQPVTLWELLTWTYGPQRADRLGLGRSLGSRMRWAEQLVGMDTDGARPAVHPDAAAVHRVVAGLLDESVARLVIEAARTGIVPERCETVPQPGPRANEERGGAAHVVTGQWVEVPAIRLTAAERRKLAETEDHGEVSRSATPTGSHRWKFRVDLRPRRRCKRAVQTQGVDGQPRDRTVGFARGDQVWSAWCPLDYAPDPSFIAMTNAIADAFEEAILTLDEALGQLPFRTRRIVEAE